MTDININSIVCIDARGEFSNLTYGKVYKKVDEDICIIKIINDKGKQRGYFNNRFIPLIDARDKKLKSLGL